MLERKPSFTQISRLFSGVLIMLIALSVPTNAYADDPTLDNGKCITCHEDLYFLHDTGKWFCLKEAPMACVDCHGGDPTASNKEIAHTNLASHPVINGDVSKCQECHPEQSDERVALFEKTAGISKVLVAVPYTPAYSSEFAETIPVTSQQVEEPHAWLSAMEIIPVLLISSIALVLYIVYRVRHTSKGKS